MIRINVAKIKKWNKILIFHNQYFKEIVSINYTKAKINSPNNYDLANKFLKRIIKDPNEELALLGNVAFDKMLTYCREYDKFLQDEKIIIKPYGEIKKIDSTSPVKLLELNKLFKEIFNYKKFSGNVNNISVNSEKISWNKNELFNMMGITACPYCNRQYITNYKHEKKNKTTATLDHFINEAKYPFLALSLYNFIPSCSVCNSYCKGSIDTSYDEYVYPYLEEFNCFFNTKGKNGSTKYLSGIGSDFEIVIDSKNTKEKKSINLFRVNEMYESHKNEVIKMIQKNIIYSDELLDNILKNNKNLCLNTSRLDLKTLLYDMVQEKDYLNMPLSKMKNDICKRLNILS